MADILSLTGSARAETVTLDRECLDKLYERLGFHDADHLVCRAVDEISQRLGECGPLWTSGDWTALHGCVGRIDQMATQVGMPALARSARDVTTCIRSGDRPALDATLWRMIRIGEASLSAVWGQRDLSL